MKAVGAEPVNVEVNSRLPNMGMGMGVLGYSYFFTKISPDLRDKLPQPLDIPNHLGNVNISFVVGAVAGTIAGKLFERFHRPSGNESSVKRRLYMAMSMAGLAAGAVINAYSETRLGLELGGWFKHSTRDLLDMGYGIAGATAGAVLSSEVSISPAEIEEDTVTQPTQDRPNFPVADLGESHGFGQSALLWPDNL